MVLKKPAAQTAISDETADKFRHAIVTVTIDKEVMEKDRADVKSNPTEVNKGALDLIMADLAKNEASLETLIKLLNHFLSFRLVA